MNLTDSIQLEAGQWWLCDDHVTVIHICNQTDILGMLRFDALAYSIDDYYEGIDAFQTEGYYDVYSDKTAHQSFSESHRLMLLLTIEEYYMAHQPFDDVLAAWNRYHAPFQDINNAGE